MTTSYRKPNRIPEYDYRQDSAYFITICTENHRCILAQINEDEHYELPAIQLSELGKIVDESVRAIPEHYPTVKLDQYIVMPNHVHLLLRIVNQEGMKQVSVSTVVQQMKGYVTKKAGRPVWQKLFYDHVIRNDADYRIRWQYIENNPYRWLEDRYYR